MLDNRDFVNPGRGTHVVTWRATLPAGTALGNAIEDICVEDPSGAPIVIEQLPVPVLKIVGQPLLVYVNEHIAAE